MCIGYLQVTTEIKDRKEKEENRERMGRMESSRDDFLKQVQQERHDAYLVSGGRLVSPSLHTLSSLHPSHILLPPLPSCLR